MDTVLAEPGQARNEDDAEQHMLLDLSARTSKIFIV